MTRPAPLITLLTDFGTSGSYVGEMKGVILSIAPDARIEDISHDIPAHDVREAAWVLWTAGRRFPRGTIHVAVVDPGVGSSRRPLLLSTVEHAFVGPDNGIFSHVLASAETRGCIEITSDHYMHRPVSDTFHGRDIFAPVAAWLARGVSPDAFGGPASDPTCFDRVAPARVSDRVLRVPVLHVDRFGNVILAIDRETLERAMETAGARGLRVRAGGTVAEELRRTYEGAQEGRPFLLFGSSDYLEIAVARASAAELLGLSAGESVDLELTM